MGSLQESKQRRFSPRVTPAVIGLSITSLKLLDPRECRVECALLDREHLVGHLAETLDDAVAVQRPEAEGPKDQHVEGALEQVGFRVGHGVPPGAYAEMGACLNTLGIVE